MGKKVGGRAAKAACLVKGAGKVGNAGGELASCNTLPLLRPLPQAVVVLCIVLATLSVVFSILCACRYGSCCSCCCCRRRRRRSAQAAAAAMGAGQGAAKGEGFQQGLSEAM